MNYQNIFSFVCFWICLMIFVMSGLYSLLSKNFRLSFFTGSISVFIGICLIISLTKFNTYRQSNPAQYENSETATSKKECQHQWTEIDSLEEGRCIIYCPACKEEKTVESKTWRKEQADMEYQREMDKER